MAVAALDLERTEMDICLDTQFMHELSLGNPLSEEEYWDAYLFGKRFSEQTDLGYDRVMPLMIAAWNDLIGPSNRAWHEMEDVVLAGYYHLEPQFKPYREAA
jgi:hypothetical protein